MKILAQLPPEAKKDQLVTLDMEMFNQMKERLHRPHGDLACISVKLEGDKNVYQLYDAADLKKLVNVVKKGIWVFHNATYDLRQWRRFAPNMQPHFVWDTMLVDQSMQGGYFKTFSLSDLVRRWLGKGMEKETREHFYTANVMTAEMKKYAAQDVIDTEAVAIEQRRKYLNDPALKAYLVADEPMIWPVLDMPGIRVDVEGWIKMSEGFMQRAEELQNELGLNVAAHAQVKDYLKRKAHLNLPDTSKDTLAEYADNPIVAKILEARMYRKASGTYGLKWLEENVEPDGKVYASYNITGTDDTGVSTGRMSCKNPNMQNIPQRKLPVYRTQFLASEGNLMEIWDVAQQEPCITAYHSQDRVLLNAIRNGEDLHLAVARAIYDDPNMPKTDPRRKEGKEVNLGLVYGLTQYGLARKLGCTNEHAEGLLKKYFQKFTGVAAWIQSQKMSGFRNGYVQTALGRKAWLNTYDRKWENNSINSPIQGGAADHTKVWARKYWEQCRKEGIPYTVVEFVHDETVKDTPKDCVRDSQRLTQVSFQEASELLYKNVPFKVEGELGKSWAAKNIEAEQIGLGDDDE